MTRGKQKKDLVKELLKVVQMTRAGSDIKDIRLDEEETFVIIEWNNGHRLPVLVECDSGISLLRDVLFHIN